VPETEKGLDWEFWPFYWLIKFYHVCWEVRRKSYQLKNTIIHQRGMASTISGLYRSMELRIQKMISKIVQSYQYFLKDVKLLKVLSQYITLNFYD